MASCLPVSIPSWSLLPVFSLLLVKKNTTLYFQESFAARYGHVLKFYLMRFKWVCVGLPGIIFYANTDLPVYIPPAMCCLECGHTGWNVLKMVDERNFEIQGIGAFDGWSYHPSPGLLPSRLLIWYKTKLHFVHASVNLFSFISS